MEISTVKISSTKSSKKLLPPLEKEDKTTTLKNLLQKTEIKSMKNIVQER